MTGNAPWMDIYCQAIRSGASRAYACAISHVGPLTLTRARRANPEFDAAVLAAEEAGEKRAAAKQGKATQP